MGTEDMGMPVPRMRPVWTQGKPKLGPTREPCAQARCAYCGRYGALGQCEGCGAPNAPNVPDDREIIDATTFNKDGRKTFVYGARPPKFDRVKR